MDDLLFSRYPGDDKTFVYAKTIDGVRIFIGDADQSHNTAYYCEQCGCKMIARFCTKKISHFAHHYDIHSTREQRDCSKKLVDEPIDMSEWHKSKQNMFPPEYTEVYFIGGRRADVYIPQANKVIEFQHSPLHPVIFHNRNVFYNKHGIKVLWLFDFDEIAKKKLLIYVNPKNYDERDKKIIGKFPGQNVMVYQIDRKEYQNHFAIDSYLFWPQVNNNVILSFEHTYNYNGNTLTFHRKVLHTRNADPHTYKMYVVEDKQTIPSLASIASTSTYPAGAPDVSLLKENRKKHLSMLQQIALNILEQTKNLMVPEKYPAKYHTCTYISSTRDKTHILLSDNTSKMLVIPTTKEDSAIFIQDKEASITTIALCQINLDITDYSAAEKEILGYIKSGILSTPTYRYVPEYDLWDKIQANEWYNCPEEKKEIRYHYGIEYSHCHECYYLKDYDGKVLHCRYRERLIYQTGIDFSPKTIRKLFRNDEGLITYVEILDGDTWKAWSYQSDAIDTTLRPTDANYEQALKEKIKKAKEIQIAKAKAEAEQKAREQAERAKKQEEANRIREEKRKAAEAARRQEAEQLQEKLRSIFDTSSIANTPSPSASASSVPFNESLSEKLIYKCDFCEKHYSAADMVSYGGSVPNKNYCRCCKDKPAVREYIDSLFNLYNKCPECKEGTLIEKRGPYGKFLGCNRYPKCKCRRNMPKRN